MREYGTIPVDPSDDAGDEGGISDWVSLKLQATDPKSHTPVRTFYTRFSSVPLPAKSDGRLLKIFLEGSLGHTAIPLFFRSVRNVVSMELS